jgi:tRNA pseudouridine38-40 synthase
MTVQSVLEAALAELLGQPVTVAVAGRTDRGVHADGQVVHVDVAAALADVHGRGLLRHLESLARALDVATPDSIAVHAVRRVPDRFHARFSATSRTYRYRLRDMVDPRAPRTAEAADVWGIIGRLDVTAMRVATRPLIGEHDFAAFCRRSPGRTTVRRIHGITVRRVAAEGEGRIDVRVHGTAFCHQQVRSIVGCLVEVARGRRPPGWVATVLTSQDRSLAAPVAPPHGLTLERVTYGPGRPAAPPPGARRGPGGGGLPTVGPGAG